MNTLVLDSGNGIGSRPVREHVESPKGNIDRVPVTLPGGKIGNTVVYVSKRNAELHAQKTARILAQRSIADKTTYSEVVGDIRDGYELRALAVLDENSGNITFIPTSGEDVPGKYIVESRGVDMVQFYPETLVGNVVPVNDAMDKFRSA